MKPLAIALMGPTASGKTDLAISLREKLNVEIVSVDSAMVYRGLDIGAAKPSQDELRQAPHRLIDIRDPVEAYSAAEFCKDATVEIREIVESGGIPLLVGGTMMYFKSLLEGLSDLPVADDIVREQINQEAAEHGWPYIHSLLKQVDPDSAANIHPNHSQRLSRALEVFRITGMPISRLQGNLVGGLFDDYQWIQLAIAPLDRSVLHERIEKRFLKMLELGMINEVKSLMQRQDLHKDLPAIRSVGYRQVWEYLEGAYSYGEMIEKGVAATRQLAKRQLTWLRSWQNLNWIYTQSKEEILLTNEEILDKSLKFIQMKAI